MRMWVEVAWDAVSTPIRRVGIDGGHQPATDSHRVKLRSLPHRLGGLIELISAQENACRYCYGMAHAQLRMMGYDRRTIERIEREIAATRDGAEGRIRLKANALVDEQVIDALYRDSQAGVRVEVVVRGICALKPGATGYSDNIVVRSILGRFLEHSRIIHFNAIDEFWIGSADMMHRNLDRRVEVMAQVKDPRLTAQLNDVFESAMDPATRCWELGVDGHWTASPQEGHTVRDHQVSLMECRRHP